MNRYSTKHLARLSIVLLVALILMTSCRGMQIIQGDELVTENQSIELGEAESARIQIEMALGGLKIRGGSSKLLEAVFEYNLEEWKPELSSEVVGGEISVAVSQPDIEGNIINRDGENLWDFTLSNEVPIDLEVSTGASDSDLDLTTIDLTSLNVRTGAGDGTINLAGDWQHDVNVRIEGGVGHIVVILPSGMGVRVSADMGIGNISTSNLSKDGNTYINDAYGSAEHNLNLDIETGIGQIELKVE